MYSSTFSPLSSSAEKLLSLEERSHHDRLSSDLIEKMLLGAKPSRLRCFFQNAVIHAGLLTIYTVMIFSFWPKVAIENLEVYSPALPAVNWEFRTFENSLETANPYKGPPRAELDKAWNKLLAPSAIRVSKEDLDRINRTSVPLLDGSGYFGTLDVHHQLHCLRWVRQSLHPEYYGEFNTKEENRGQHIDHCLDALRQFVMCKADVGLLTYDWMPQFHRPWPNFEIQHKCANWDRIQEWAESHSFDGFDEKLIRHPSFHPELASPFSYAVSGNDIPTKP